MRRLIYGMLISAGCNHFRRTATICRAVFQKHLAFYMLIIFHTDNLLRRAVYAGHQFIIIWRIGAHVLARWPAGNGRTGFCLKMLLIRARQHLMNIAGNGKTGSITARLNIGPCVSQLVFLICPVLAKSSWWDVTPKLCCSALRRMMWRCRSVKLSIRNSLMRLAT